MIKFKICLTNIFHNDNFEGEDVYVKKSIIVLCSAAIIACFMLIPVTVNAEERGCNHNMVGEYDVVVSNELAYNHQFLIYNGATGPVYGTCAVNRVTHNIYPRCTICGYVFLYNAPTVKIEYKHQQPECPNYN